MNQDGIVLEFMRAVHELDEPNYIEQILLSGSKSPQETDFIKMAFQLAVRPLPLEMKEA